MVRKLSLVINLILLVVYLLDKMPFEMTVVLLLGNALPWLIDPEWPPR